MRIQFYILALLAGPTVVMSQTTTPPSNASQNGNHVASFWQPFSSVTVYIDGTQFPPGSPSEQAVKQGFQNNQNAYVYTFGIGYSFVSVQSIPLLSTGEAYVTTASFSNPKQYGNNDWTATPTSSGYNYTDSSLISLSQNITSNTAGLTYAISHEDSHNYGLGDCPDCLASSSIMTYQNSINNPPFEGPQPNDINASQSYSGGGGGGGGYGGCGDRMCEDSNSQNPESDRR